MSLLCVRVVVVVRLSKATDAVSKIGRKSSAKCLWMVILVLFLALIGVIVLSFLF